MARLFDDAQSEYLEWSGASPPVSGPPFTLACWARTDTDAADQALMWLGDKDSATSVIGSLELVAVDGPNRYVCAKSVSGATEGSALIGNYSTNTWHHVCGRFATASFRRVFLDGAGIDTDTTNVVGATADRVSIGRRGDSAPGAYLSGAVAEAAIWNVALFEPEIVALAKGFSPLQVKPHALVAYWPLGGFAGANDNDRLGVYDLSAVGTPWWTDHPPLVYSGGPGVGTPAASGSPRIPWHLFQGRAA